MPLLSNVAACEAQLPQPTTPLLASGAVVVKVGGAALDSAEALAHAAAVIRSAREAHGGRVVLVHGGGGEVDRHLIRLGLQSRKHDGIRATPAEHIDEVVAVLAGKVNKRLVGELLRHGVPAVGICLSDGGLARAEQVSHPTHDVGCVGRVVEGNPLLAHVLLTYGFCPVICSIGLNEHGQRLNVNADAAAAGLVRLLGASELVLLTDVPGVLDRNGSLLPQLSAQEAEQRIAAGEIAGGMIAKVRSAVETTTETGVPVTIASWHTTNSSGAAETLWPAQGTQFVAQDGRQADQSTAPGAIVA